MKCEIGNIQRPTGPTLQHDMCEVYFHDNIYVRFSLCLTLLTAAALIQ